MAWQGNTDNPVPSNEGPINKDNPYFVNKTNRASDIRRDEDEKKNFTITLMDVDTTLLEYLQNVINPSVVDSGNIIKVPILYGSPERWKAIQNDGYYRDINGKIQLPAIMFKRQSFSKNENLMTFNRYLTYPVMTRFTEKNKYDKFNLLNNSAKPVNQIIAVTLPDHVKVEYEFVVWTEYVEQMNSILEKINFASEDYWGDSKKFKFRASVNDYSHTTEIPSDKDRMVRTNFNVSVFAYLLPDSFENRKSTVQKILTPKQIKITGEVVNSAQMNAVNNSANNSILPNKIGLKNNMVVDRSTNFETPEPHIVGKKIFESLSAMKTNPNLSLGEVWHEPPTSMDAYGQEGWMAFDESYQYIYINGKWRRQSLSNFE